MDLIKGCILGASGIFLVFLGVGLFADGLLEAAGAATISWYSHNNYALRHVLEVIWLVSGLLWVGFGIHLIYEWRST